MSYFYKGFWPTYVDIFWETTFRPLGGAAAAAQQIFLHDLDNTNNKIYLPEVRLS